MPRKQARLYRWSMQPVGPPPLTRTTAIDRYEHHERAEQAYALYISGQTEMEIATFLGIDLPDAERDIRHIQSMLPARTVIMHNNDRERIVLQRLHAFRYDALLKRTLEIEPESFLAAGVSPTVVLKEFREAVGMTEKPGGMSVSVTTNTMNLSGSASGVRSAEEIIRAVRDKLDAVEPIVEPFDVEATPVHELPEDASDGEGTIPDPDDPRT